MTEEDLKEFLEANKTEIQAQVKAKMISGLLENHRWTMTDQITEVVSEFMKTEIMPQVKEYLQAEKGAIMEAAISSASQIGDMLSKALVEKAAKNISGDSYQFRNTLKGIFE